MIVLDQLKQVLDTVKAIGNIPLQQELIKVQQQVNELVEDNKNLKANVEDLSAKLSLQGQLVFRDDAYYKPDDEGPYCSSCWDTSKIAIRMHGGASEGTFGCPKCGTTTWTKEFRDRY